MSPSEIDEDKWDVDLIEKKWWIWVIYGAKNGAKMQKIPKIH